MSQIKLKPSKSNEWMLCNASAKLQAEFVNRTERSDAQKDGVAAHYAFSNQFRVSAGDADSDGTIIDADMVSYADELREIIANWRCDLHVEEKLFIPLINCNGTPDVFSIDFDNKTVHVLDYKYGHTAIPVEKNWQLILYIDGIINQYIPSPVDLPDWKFKLYIYQPRAIHPDGELRENTICGAELRELFSIIEKNVRGALSDNPVATTGIQCSYCQVRHKCATLQNSAMISVNVSEESVLHELDIHQAGREVLLLESALKILEARKKGLETQIEYELLQGEMSQIFTLDRARPRERWKEGSEETIIEIGKLLGKNLCSPVTPITPAQCRKLDIDKTIIDEFTERPVGALKLVKLDLNQTKKLFGK